MTIRPAKFCPQCGNALDTTRFEGRERRSCTACDRIVFRQPLPAAGVAVVDGERVLLVRRTAPPNAGQWAIPGGVMEHDENARETAARELEEETNVEVSPSAFVLFDTWHHERSTEDVRSVTIGYAVSLSETTGEPKAGSDAGAVRFSQLEDHMNDERRPGERKRMQRAIEAVRR